MTKGFIFGIILLAIVNGGCGYRLGTTPLFEGYETISIPYVEGDEKGYLTSALIKEIATRTPLNYSNSCGDLELQVSLLDYDSQNIGYRYAEDENNANSKILVAQEGRLVLAACISLIDRKNEKILWGPQEIQETLTFDFEPDFSHVNFHAFSLGQLEMRPLAEKAALDALDALLAQKIVDSLLYSW